MILIYLYFILFFPVFESLSKISLLAYLVIDFFVLSRNAKECRYILKQLDPYRKSLIWLLVYLVTVVCVFGYDWVILIAFFRNVLIPLINLVSFCTVWVKSTKRNIISFLIKVSMVASFISIVLYFVPGFAATITSLITSNDAERFISEGRGYGFAGSLFYGYSLLLSIVAFLCLNYESSKWRFLKTIIILAPCVLNARIGLFVFVGLQFWHLLFFSSIKDIIRMALGSITVIVIIYVSGIYRYFESSLDFALDAVYITSDFLFNTEFGDGSGHFTGLAGNQLIWPNTVWEWIVGRGEYILFGSRYGASDVGIVLQINYGGLIYVILNLVPYLMCIISAYKEKIKEPIGWLVIIVFISDWKGDLFLQANVALLILMLYLLSDIFGSPKLYKNKLIV